MTQLSLLATAMTRADYTPLNASTQSAEIDPTKTYATIKTLQQSDAQNHESEQKYDKWKVLLLIAFCLIRLLVGFICTMTGPILVDLQHQTHSTTTELSSIFFARGVGFFLGSVLSVYVFKSNLTWIMVSFLVLVGGSCLLIPMSVNVYVLALAYLVQTTGFNIFRTTSPALLFSITKGDDRGPALQLVTMTFIIGATLSPPIAAPFVTSSSNVVTSSPGQDGYSDSSPYSNLTTVVGTGAHENGIHHYGNNDFLVWDSNNKLNWLFMGMLVYVILVTISTSIFGKCSGVDFSLVSKTKDTKNVNKSKSAMNIFVYAICTIVMTIGGAAFTTGFNFVTFFVVKGMNETITFGEIADTVFSITVAITSVVTIFTIKWWGYVTNIWIICVFMLLTPCLMLPILLFQNYWLFCVALVSLGIATSFLFTPIFMWGAEKVDSLTLLSAWIQNGFTLAEITFPFIVGLTLDLCDMVFVYWISGLCVSFVLIFAAGEMVYRSWIRRNTVPNVEGLPFIISSK